MCTNLLIFFKKYSYQLNLKEGTNHTTWMAVFGLISQVRNKQFKRAHQLVLYFFSLCIQEAKTLTEITMNYGGKKNEIDKIFNYTC